MMIMMMAVTMLLLVVLIDGMLLVLLLVLCFILQLRLLFIERGLLPLRARLFRSQPHWLNRGCCDTRSKWTVPQCWLRRASG
jgi:hypothetical protein